jgi:hypothetical protein
MRMPPLWLWTGAASVALEGGEMGMAVLHLAQVEEGVAAEILMPDPKCSWRRIHQDLRQIQAGEDDPQNGTVAHK